MTARHAPASLPPLRAVAFAAVLLSLTLGALQPLVHAMLLRGAESGDLSWRAFCLAAPDEPGKERPVAPADARRHDACNVLPPAGLFPVDVDIVRADLPIDIEVPPRRQAPHQASPRDGPIQPRAPPASA